jgi:hypothetical protein
VFLISPSLILAVAIASVYAVLYNLWRAGTMRDLLFYAIAAWVGFGLGQLAGWLIGLNWLMVGPLHVIEATLLSWGLLFLASWLRLPDQERTHTTASN